MHKLVSLCFRGRNWDLNSNYKLICIENILLKFPSTIERSSCSCASGEEELFLEQQNLQGGGNYWWVIQEMSLISSIHHSLRRSPSVASINAELRRWNAYSWEGNCRGIDSDVVLIQMTREEWADDAQLILLLWLNCKTKCEFHWNVISLVIFPTLCLSLFYVVNCAVKNCFSYSGPSDKVEFYFCWQKFKIFNKCTDRWESGSGRVGK